MILLRRNALSHAADTWLQGRQQEIDLLPNYADRVAAAEKAWKAHRHNTALAQVLVALEVMAPGASRCMYCEDSLAAEIEHFRPKSAYPEATFVWLNYVYACGPCNRAKGNRFAIFPTGSEELLEVTRNAKQGSPLIAPPPGKPVLLDPTIDDASRLLMLDIVETFYFSPLGQVGSVDYERARYTIERLQLNVRDAVVRQRREYFETYIARLESYRLRRDQGADEGKLGEYREQIQRLGHPTVWMEIRRQHGRLGRLRSLFADVPEALEWDSEASASKRQ